MDLMNGMKSMCLRLVLVLVIGLMGMPGWADGYPTANAPAFPQSTVAWQQPGPDPSGARQQLKATVRTLEGKYLVSPGDTLSLSVYNAPEFDQPALLVRPDGFVTIKPFGEVDVAGMDVDSLSQLISQKLSYYLKEPRVSVSVVKFHPAIVYVLGAVEKPGAYEIHGDIENPDSVNSMLARGRLTVSNLIANAGGIRHNADVSNITIRNNGNNQERTVNLMSMLRDGDTSQDLMVHSGDTVYVPSLPGNVTMDDETFKLLSRSALAPDAITVRVLGRVTTPGVYQLPAESPGVNSAIASAQGFLIEANEHRVKVLRLQPDGSLAEIKVNPGQEDFLLRNNDVVLVDERRTPIAGRGWDYTTRVFTPFLTMGNLINSVLDIVDPGRRFPFAGN